MIELLENTELSDYFYEHYPVIQHLVTKEQIRILFEKYRDRVIVVRDWNYKILGIGFYYKLDDETLEKMRNKILEITIPDMESCLSQNDENIHFVGLVADSYKTIMKGLRKVIEKEKPKTISWFSPDMKQFFIRRIICHHS